MQQWQHLNETLGRRRKLQLSLQVLWLLVVLLRSSMGLPLPTACIDRFDRCAELTTISIASYVKHASTIEPIASLQRAQLH